MSEEYEAYIKIITGDGIEQIVPFSDSISFGRKGSGSTSDITIDSPLVSRNHGRFYSAMGRFFYEDLGSSNGTYINDCYLGGRKIQSMLLADGDILRIGDYGYYAPVYMQFTYNKPDLGPIIPFSNQMMVDKDETSNSEMKHQPHVAQISKSQPLVAKKRPPVNAGEFIATGNMMKGNDINKSRNHSDVLSECAVESQFTADGRIASYVGDKPYAFISYSHRNAGSVAEILKKLKDAGVRFWYDEGIEPGKEWDNYLSEKIVNSEYVIAFITPEYAESEHCLNELIHAHDKGKKLLLIYLRETTLQGGIEMRMARKQAIKKYELSHSEFYNNLYSISGFSKIRK